MNVFIAAVGLFPGAIIKFSGAIVDIPTGWVLCDGTNDTPNLTNKFVVGAGDVFPVGDTGGANTHAHDASQAAHTHVLSVGDEVAAGADFSAGTNAQGPVITVEVGGNWPPYYALCYIMKT